MSTNLKALAVVLIFALVVFYLSRPLLLGFMTNQDFDRRRNIWLCLTVTAFCAPSFWIYCLVAIPVLIKASRNDSNPLALYVLLLHVIPPYSFEIPSVLVNRLFSISNYRLLALFVLIPIYLDLRKSNHKHLYKSFRIFDFSILLFLLLQVVHLAPYEQVTNTFRRVFLFLLDDALLFYVVSRVSRSREKSKEVIASFCLSCAIMAPAAIFESSKVWLLYVGIGDEWGTQSLSSTYLFRGSDLRAQVSTGHSLGLGLVIAAGLALWPILGANQRYRSVWFFGGLAMFGALLASFARGPVLALVVAYFVFFLLIPRGLNRLFRSLILGIPVLIAAIALRGGQAVFDALPFFGKTDNFNVDYRIELARTAWALIVANPLFGDPFFITKMEHLRQGEGIIDLVNVYAAIALLYGIVGLILYILPLASAACVTAYTSRQSINKNTEQSLLAPALMSSLIVIGVCLATGSLAGALPIMYYLVTGLAAGNWYQFQNTLPSQKP